MSNTTSYVATEDKPQTADATEERVRNSDANRKMMFECTVEVDGTFTGQMLNALFGADSQVNGRLRFEGAVQIDGTFTGNITAIESVELRGHARVKGDVTTPALAIDKGAVFDGITKMIGTPVSFASLERRARPRSR